MYSVPVADVDKFIQIEKFVNPCYKKEIFILKKKTKSKMVNQKCIIFLGYAV